MTKKNKFTFSTKKPTGRWKSFEKPYHKIKFNGKEVGSIDDDEHHKIRLMVYKKDIMEDKNPNCKWRWITLKRESPLLEDAQRFLESAIDIIVEKYDLRTMDKD